MEIQDVKMTEKLSERIDALMKCIGDAITAHEQGIGAPLSPKLLMQVQQELQHMHKTLVLRNFTPAYPRFLLDWPGDERLVRELVQLAYDYKKGIA
jgi:hypothetical protein